MSDSPIPPKEEVYRKITSICFLNGGVTKTMVDKLYDLYSQHTIATLERLEKEINTGRTQTADRVIKEIIDKEIKALRKEM